LPRYVQIVIKVLTAFKEGTKWKVSKGIKQRSSNRWSPAMSSYEQQDKATAQKWWS